MKKSVTILAILLMALSNQAAVYHLEKVDSIISGKKYVFVNNYCALTADGSPSVGLDVTAFYKDTCLVGDESYVWQADKVMHEKGKFYLTSYASTKLLVDDGKLCVATTPGAAGSMWQFDFQPSDSTSQIYYQVNSTNTYYWYYKSTQYTYVCQVKKSKPTDRFSVFCLIPDTYDRVAVVGQLSTICLPFAVDSVIGADVYQISYLEKDNAGEPYKLYYEQVEGDLTAGRPYLFVPTASQVQFQKKNTETVAEPQYFDDGFYGTFGGLNDAEAGTPGNLLEGNYVVYNNSFQKCGGNCSLSANRAYIKMDEVPTTKPVHAVSCRTLAISQNGVEFFYPSALENVREDKQDECHKLLLNGRLVIVRNDQIYTIQGFIR